MFNSVCGEQQPHPARHEAGMEKTWSGGGFGDLGALCLRVGVTAGPGGLGSWLVCRREHGLVHALGPGSGVGVFDASVPPQGGSNRGGVNGLYLGVLLSYVVWELTG